jgi:poly(3-hydroxybutyrate) depolymerase
MMASDSGPASTGGDGGPAQKSAGCGMVAPSLETSIKVGSSTGNITVDVPTNYDKNKAYPLVLVWHGAGVTGTAFHGYLDMHTAVGNDAIVVTPECLDGGSTWPSDTSYPDALLAHFEASYCIDKSRLFTAGHSMGGFYTGLIGCERGDVFRGDAVLAAPHPTGACKKGTMAVLMSVGSSDPTGTMPATEFPWWAMENGCTFSSTTPVDFSAFYKSTPDEAGTCSDYGGCGALTELRTCTFTGGHEIPPWVAGAIWNFFKKL